MNTNYLKYWIHKSFKKLKKERYDKNEKKSNRSNNFIVEDDSFSFTTESSDNLLVLVFLTGTTAQKNTGRFNFPVELPGAALEWQARLRQNGSHQRSLQGDEHRGLLHQRVD